MECKKVIEKNALRVAAERELEFNGMKRLGAAYLHVPCAMKELGAGLGASLRANGKLTEAADLKQLAAALK